MKKRILVVDDEPDVNLALKEALEENGLKVDAFNDSLLALENFEAGSYDLLILDIRMPKMNGFELYKEIKRIDDKVKVCFLTASEMFYEKFRKEESYSKFDKELFIAKPIENEELLDHLNKVINNSK